ncbi:MAG: antibiotic biosynthesis monooxygenase [Bacteroidales bacterium]|nr:antibiotic biosynthesis monooxygenase [Bacteroidales bacterium]MBQ7984529.1 antibiotic biosynthesis monooxygenase [Bacteroidales bacterium]
MTKTAHYDIAENLIVRIAEIEVEHDRLDEYLQRAKDIATVSMDKEKGVICLLPMRIKEKPNHLRILEIYRGEAAYQSHIKTEHFLKYKQSTADMVKDLRLIDMQALNYGDLSKIFRKLN